MNFGVAIPFVQHLGFELMLFEGGASQIDYTPLPEHLNSFHVTHGGAVMTLQDVVMATAARSVQQDMGGGHHRDENQLHAAGAGRRQQAHAKGRLIHRTATMAFTEGTVYDDQGRICSHATGTFKYVKRLAVGPKGVNPLNTVISTD